MDLYLWPLPYLDYKWIHADLIASIRNPGDAALLWNTLIQDYELMPSLPVNSVVNSAGNLAYLGDDGKHYCGASKLQCNCCPITSYCGPKTVCNCPPCHALDSEAAIKKAAASSVQTIFPTTATSGGCALSGIGSLTTAENTAGAVGTTGFLGKFNQQRLSSAAILENWFWAYNTPSIQEKFICYRALLNEMHDLSLWGGSCCQSARHLRQQLHIYERYYVALARCKTKQQQHVQQQQQLQPLSQKDIPSIVNLNSNSNQNLNQNKTIEMAAQNNAAVTALIGENNLEKFTSNNRQQQQSLQSIGNIQNRFASASKRVYRLQQDGEQATMCLARVCTRAALNFTFFFLRRAWRSGEDTEMCSELLGEALESLQELPEALLYDMNDVS